MQVCVTREKLCDVGGEEEDVCDPVFSRCAARSGDRSRELHTLIKQMAFKLTWPESRRWSTKSFCHAVSAF